MDGEGVQILEVEDVEGPLEHISVLILVAGSNVGRIFCQILELGSRATKLSKSCRASVLDRSAPDGFLHCGYIFRILRTVGNRLV